MIRVLLFASAILLFSCDNTNNNPNNTNEETAKLEGKLVDFEPHEINATLYFNFINEKESDSLIDIIHEAGDIIWKVNSGETFSFQIEDWGDESKEVNHYKDWLNNQIFEYDIIIENDSALLYAEYIPTDTSNKNYQFYTVKTVNDINYVIQSDRMKDFSMDDAKLMLEVASTFMTKKEDKKPV